MAGEGEDDALTHAVTECLAPLAHLEKEGSLYKLEKKIRTYFRNAVRNMDWHSKPWDELVEDYADKVFETLCTALSDRKWLAQADFLMALDAGVKETFPPDVLKGVSQAEFEKAVLHANDRAYEEQRLVPLLWDSIATVLSGPKTKRKAYDAWEQGRKVAVGVLGDSVDDFVETWVDATIKKLSAECGGEPESTVTPEQAAQIFRTLMGNGGLPVSLVDEHGLPPPDWPVVEEAVYQAYAEHGSGPATRAGGKGHARLTANARGDHGGDREKRVYAGAHREPTSAKRPRAMQLQQRRGHPSCTQEEDCVGNPRSALMQHVEGGNHGDIYCEMCWDLFSFADPSLVAVPFEG